MKMIRKGKQTVMRLLKTESLRPGMKLGKSIYNERRNVLLGEGMELTERVIQRLKDLQISFVYIEDNRTTHIKPRGAISEKLRQGAVKTIEETFLEVQNEVQLSNSFVVEKAAKRFAALIRNMMGEIKGNQELLSLLAEVFVYDNYIFTHSLNVTLYTLAIGMELKLPAKQMEMLGLGAIMHDVGKMIISPDILLKPSRLTEEEYNEVKKHPEAGYNLLREIHTVPLLVAHCAYQHHERMDGSGYPRGIKENEIHNFAKIIAVADVFDAVTSNRVYRQAMLPHEGLEVLYCGSGRLFDMKIVEAFRRAVAIYPNGVSVGLNDGRKGIVASQNTELSDRPVIEIIEENGVGLEQTYSLDLKLHHNITIITCN
jgi:HD-GYP domain-containing protein (c-di-GMP phosphodiesterase class II)